MLIAATQRLAMIQLGGPGAAMVGLRLVGGLHPWLKTTLAAGSCPPATGRYTVSIWAMSALASGIQVSHVLS